MAFKRPYPTPVNRDILHQELLDNGVSEFSFRDDALEVYDDSKQNIVDNTVLPNHDGNQKTDDQQEISFTDAMMPIIRDWHKGTQTISQSLASVNTVLNNHPAHKSIMNNRVWPMKRLIVNPLADVTLGNILGNANAEAAYLDAVFEYAERVKTWRE